MQSLDFRRAFTYSRFSYYHDFLATSLFSLITLLTSHNNLLDTIASCFYFSFNVFLQWHNNDIVPLFTVYIDCVMLLQSLYIDSSKHSPKFEPNIFSRTMFSYNLRQGVQGNHVIQLGLKINSVMLGSKRCKGFLHLLIQSGYLA